MKNILLQKKVSTFRSQEAGNDASSDNESVWRKSYPYKYFYDVTQCSFLIGFSHEEGEINCYA
jgi:hypothetical protein